MKCKALWQRRWAFLVGMVLLPAMKLRADSWIGDSLELSVADSSTVVRATIDSVAPVVGNYFSQHTATLSVKETLKGNAVKTITCMIPNDDERNLADWQKNSTELLVCLVPSSRYRMKGDDKPLPAEWAALEGRGGQTGIIPLDGHLDRGAPTMDFEFLTKPDDILALVKKEAAADAATKVQLDKNGLFPSLEIDVPYASAMEKVLRGISANTLVIPLNEVAEDKAKKWVKSEDSIERLNAVAVLSHFKTDENIAALKSLLNDPDMQSEMGGAGTIRTYPVRKAAQDALKAWGIDANAAVRETVP